MPHRGRPVEQERGGWIEAALRAGVSEHDLWFVVHAGPG